MAKSGDRFDMPDGSAYIVLQPTAETAGEYVEMEFVLPSGCVLPRRTSTLTRWRSTWSLREASR